MSLLEVRGVGKSFAGLRALHNVSFSVEAGEILGIMGANGAGKTTLFSLIAGHQLPSEGSIKFEGQSLIGLRPDRICRRGIARTFQIVRPFAGLRVLENVETALLFGGGHAPDTLSGLASQILEDVGLAQQASKLAGALTLSDRKRLEVARAIGTRPRLLLLDEVMAGLTPTEVAQMLETIKRVKAKHDLSVIVVEHVVRALVELSDRIIVLHHGELIATGSPREISEHPDVLQAYFGEKAG